MQRKLHTLAVMPFLNDTNFLLTLYLSLQITILIGTIPTFP